MHACMHACMRTFFKNARWIDRRFVCSRMHARPPLQVPSCAMCAHAPAPAKREAPVMAGHCVPAVQDRLKPLLCRSHTHSRTHTLLTCARARLCPCPPAECEAPGRAGRRVPAVQHRPGAVPGPLAVYGQIRVRPGHGPGAQCCPDPAGALSRV